MKNLKKILSKLKTGEYSLADIAALCGVKLGGVRTAKFGRELDRACQGTRVMRFANAAGRRYVVPSERKVEPEKRVTNSGIKEARQCLKEGRRGAFLVYGPPMSGKSHFIASLLQRKFGESACSLWSRGGAEMNKMLTAMLPRGYIWLDAHGVRCLKSHELERFISSDRWMFRKFGTSEMATLPNNCVIFIEADENVALSMGLARRLKDIRLAARSELAAS